MTNTTGHCAPPPSSTPARLGLAETHPMLSCFDLLQEVGSHLKQGDLYHCLPVSKAFYNAMAPLIFRHVKVTKTKFLNASNPLEIFRRNTSTLPCRLIRTYATSIELPVTWFLRSERLLASMTRLRTLILPHEFAQFLVKIERIVFRPRPVLIWPLLATRHPDQEPFPLAYRLPSSALHTVIELHRLDRDMRYEVPKFWGKPRKFKTPSTPSGTITIVVLPEAWHNCTPSFLRLVDDLSCEFTKSVIDVATDYAILYPSRSVTIVGLEIVNPFRPRWHWQPPQEQLSRATAQVESMLNRKFNNLLATHHWTAEQKAQRMSSVSIVTLYDYLNAGGWSDEMDPRDVGTWLNAYDEREKLRAAAPKTITSASSVTTLGEKRKGTSDAEFELSGETASQVTKKVKTGGNSTGQNSSA